VSSIIAGVLTGALMGLFFDFLAIQALLGLRKDPPRWLQNALKQVTFFKFVMPMALFTHSSWTFAGLFAGVAYSLAEGDNPTSGLGSPFVGFTIGVLVLASICLAATALAGGRVRGWMMPAPVLFAVTFGWVLPILSD
jgi:hypothetical protein